MTKLRLLMVMLLGSGVVPGSLGVAEAPVVHTVLSVQETETKAERDARMAWWREARFGMFIHWGLYAEAGGMWKGEKVTQGGAEWIMNYASIPVAEYKGLAKEFNPTGFSAHDIVALAKAAGMRYIVITAKHHDGFAMFDSKVDAFNIVAATPFHRDPLRELAEECRKQGVKLGFYYSQVQDWTAPGGLAIERAGHNSKTHHWDAAQDGDYSTYFHTKAIPQMKELLENYKEYPVVVWFDTPDGTNAEVSADMVKLLNQHPNLIWNNRLGGGYQGDTETPEQKVPPTGYPGKDWETCMTMNGTWGYRSYDTNFKSTEVLLRNLIDIASKGGNYLLNIGPDGKGLVPEPEQERLRAMGAWLKVNGESIYGTSASLLPDPHGAYDVKDAKKWVPVWDWRSTTAKDKVYVQVLTWPEGALHLLHLEKMPRTVTKAYLLADAARAPLQFTQGAGVVDVRLPEKALDPVATVVVLETR